MDILICNESGSELCRLRLPAGTPIPATGDQLQLLGCPNGNGEMKVVGRTFSAYLPASKNGVVKPEAYEWRLTVNDTPHENHQG